MTDDFHRFTTIESSKDPIPSCESGDAGVLISFVLIIFLVHVLLFLDHAPKTVRDMTTHLLWLVSSIFGYTSVSSSVFFLGLLFVFSVTFKAVADLEKLDRLMLPHFSFFT